MKLLCCSDTHGKLPPLLDETGADAWLHAGDVYNKGHMARGQGPMSGTKELDEWVKDRTIPVYPVKGNHDCSFETPFFNKTNEITNSCCQIAPRLVLIGIGWHGGIFADLPTERDMRDACGCARHVARRITMPGDSIILLTHYPPWLPTIYAKIAGHEGWMSEAVADLMTEFKPMAVVQGHVHELFGSVVTYRAEDFQTLIVNPGPKGGILELNTDDGTVAFTS